MNRIERLKAKIRNAADGTKRTAKNLLHSAETLAVGSVGAYAEGRMSDEDGEWGYKNVPYLYMGGGVLYLTGLMASFGGEQSARYSTDLFALGTGAVGGHLFRRMYETGLDSKSGTTGRKQIRSRVPMGLDAAMRAGTQQPQQAQHVRKQQNFGTALDGLGGQL